MTRGALRIFKGSQIKIERRYVRVGIDSIEKYIEFINRNAKVIPFEASIALNKLYNNDIKNFIETHIDANMCTPLISMCRERGPRIKCSVYSDPDHIEVYSECFDAEILIPMIFGDLSNLFTFEVGYRDGIRFKRVIIPRNPVVQLAPDIIKGNVLGKQLFTMPLKTFSNAIEYILGVEEEVTELIFHIPCLDSLAIELLYRMAKTLSNRSRIYVLTASPTSDTAKRCQLNYKDMLISYIEALEILPKYNIVICSTDIVHTGLIVNRMHYIVSYEYSYRDNMDISIVRDRSYIEATSMGYLRECLCTATLTKEDLNTSMLRRM